ATDYTVYAVVNMRYEDSTYLLDGAGHSIIFGVNSDGDAGAYYVGSAKGAANATPGQKTLIAWRLSVADGARVYVNGALVYSGPYAAAPLASVTTFGRHFSVPFAYLLGDVYSFAVRFGSDTNEEYAEASAFLKSHASVTF
ncbi:hypothetical protein, partial [Hymenobacter lapidiphilus]